MFERLKPFVAPLLPGNSVRMLSASVETLLINPHNTKAQQNIVRDFASRVDDTHTMMIEHFKRRLNTLFDPNAITCLQTSILSNDENETVENYIGDLLCRFIVSQPARNLETRAFDILDNLYLGFDYMDRIQEFRKDSQQRTPVSRLSRLISDEASTSLCVGGGLLPRIGDRERAESICSTETSFQIIESIVDPMVSS